MTSFVDVRNMARWITDTGMERIIAGLVEYIEHDFGRWQLFDKTPRVASHTPFGVIELMPTSDQETYGFKYVNGHPSNPARGFQTVTAFGVLADVHNGYPTFLAEMTLLTALRTAATSALVARHLARADSSTMALIGAGSQSEFQALAMRRVLGIRDLRLWDTDPDAMRKFARNLEPLGFDVTIATSAADAVAGADIITTCTADKMQAVVLSSDLVVPGVHINAIGGDCPGKTELDPRILHRAEVFVEFEPQTHRVRLGGIRDRGLLRPALRARQRRVDRLRGGDRPRRGARRPEGPLRLHRCILAGTHLTERRAGCTVSYGKRKSNHDC
jgi:ornithine cyclodeaminase